MQTGFGRRLERFSIVTADGCEGEFAFITEEIKEGEYESAATEFGNLIHMIRVAS